MRYLSIFKGPETNEPPTQQEMETMGAYIEKVAQSGVLITTEGCLPSSSGARVRSTGGKVTVTDGPFTEAKEVIGGFAVFNVASKEEAIQQARDFLAVVGTDGECELRELYEMPAFDRSA